jgi:putative ABC transport system permease protein
LERYSGVVVEENLEDRSWNEFLLFSLRLCVNIIMEDLKDISPPAWATRLLTWYCKPELLEDLQGDLNEYFERNVKSKGIRRAKLIYMLDVLKFFRLYTMRKPKFIEYLINYVMIGSYIKTSGRSIVRNKLFSFINIVGLAVSMSVGLVLIGVLSDVLSYDTFHKNRDQVYRLISRYEYLGDKGNNFMATTSLKSAQLIKEEFTGVEEVAILRTDFQGDLQIDEKIIPLSGFWANPALFKVFSFELIQGNPATALAQPFSLVLTQTAARKLFGDEEALGKTVSLNKDKSYTVTGIIKDIPFFSHIKFEMLGSLSTREIIAKEDESENAWDNVWHTWVYLLLPSDVNTKSFKENLDNLSKKEDLSVKNTHIELALQPMRKIMFSDSMGNEIGPVLGNTLIWVFGGLAFIVVLSACFNYTNLSIARSMRRTREVGVRKVIGAMRNHVVMQFIVEAVIISLCALVIAVLGFFLLRPHFLSIEPEIQKMFTLQLSPLILTYFFAFALFVGVAAGLFPSLFFANVKTIEVLKNTSSFKGLKKITGRKVLIVIQYCISIILISASIGVYRQYQHYIGFDLGFNTENILNIELQGNKADLLKKEIQELPEVKAISQSMMVTSVGSYYGTNMKYHGSPNDSTGVGFNSVDENYMPVHGHQLIAGRNFLPKPDSAKESEVIVNQEVLKRFNIGGQDPEKAIGDVLRVDENDLTIIGVMKNFQYARANNQTSKEIVLRYEPSKARVLNVKIQSNDLIATHDKIEAIWKKIDPVHPFEAKFYNEQIEAAFAGLRATVKLAGFLAFLAICIASLGLLGMVVFTTEIRLKEISIRKVMGASEAGLLYLLGKGFIFLLLVATVISLPLVVLFFEKVVFTSTVNHAPLNLIEMLLGVLVILIIALLMIGSQTLKVAKANPAEVLKNE